MNLSHSYFLIVFFLSTSYSCYCNANQSSNTIIDSLKCRLELLESVKRFDILLELSEQTRREDPAKAESYMLEAKEYVNESYINQKLFDFYKYMAGVKLSQNQYNDCLELTEKALKLEYEDLDLKAHSSVYEQRGLAYSFLGKNVKAQEALYKGLRIADSLKLDTLKSSIYNSIGTVYLAMKDTIMVEKYFLQALDLARKVDSKKSIAAVLGNLAIIYTNQERYSDAEKLIFETIEIANKGNNKRIVGSNYYNLGAIYNAQAKHDKSLEFLQKGLEIAKQYQNSSSIAFGYLNIGVAHMELQNYQVSKEHIKTGIKMADELNHKQYHSYGLLCASEVYERSGEHKEALVYYKRHTELNDSLINEGRITAVAELQEKYETEKKEKEILTLSHDKASAEKWERTLIQTIFLLCFSLLSLGGLYYFLRQNNRKNSIIQKKNLKIASDKIELLEKGKEIIALESLVKGQEIERERLAKEMHDGLGGLLAISHSKLTNLNVPGMNTHTVLNEARDLVGNAYDQVRQISHNLMPLDLEKFGLVEALTNMIQRINQQNTICIDFRTYHFDLFLNNDLGLNIYRISQEALANILKCASAKNVLVELIQHEKKISLSIEDDGIGFDLNAKYSGIGIRNMRNRAELLNGQFNIESKISQGTTISVIFPNYSEQVHLVAQ